jgi:leucyl aminopeptidase (aminopeptidase T)
VNGYMKNFIPYWSNGELVDDDKFCVEGGQIIDFLEEDRSKDRSRRSKIGQSNMPSATIFYLNM